MYLSWKLKISFYPYNNNTILIVVVVVVVVIVRIGKTPSPGQVLTCLGSARIDIIDVRSQVRARFFHIRSGSSPAPPGHEFLIRASFIQIWIERKSVPHQKFKSLTYLNLFNLEPKFIQYVSKYLNLAAITFNIHKFNSIT